MCTFFTQYLFFILFQYFIFYIFVIIEVSTLFQTKQLSIGQHSEPVVKHGWGKSQVSHVDSHRKVQNNAKIYNHYQLSKQPQANAANL